MWSFKGENCSQAPGVLIHVCKLAKSPLDGAVNFLANTWEHIIIISFVSAFLLLF